ncbi:hypothetical protein KSP39_PZI012391 [Platanthera zijinensis]|uniref:DUF4408 domain-containing protein n=1 Tax=Platanthera zijinensis TaxID=2320716 RepID=A0AAP0BEW7_9ASPA
MDAIKAEKEIARRRFRRIRQIGQLFRFAEAAAIFLFLSYSSIHIRFDARSAGIFLRAAAAFFLSPRFVFLLGNAIVLVLLKSGHFSSGSAAAAIGEICGGEVSSYPPTTQNCGITEAGNGICVRACRRSRSEKLGRRREEVKLRRAESEVDRKVGKPLSAAAQVSGFAEEAEDAEQFRRMIEDFIAKQQQFRREELLAVMAGSVGPEEAVP